MLILSTCVTETEKQARPCKYVPGWIVVTCSKVPINIRNEGRTSVSHLSTRNLPSLQKWQLKQSPRHSTWGPTNTKYKSNTQKLSAGNFFLCSKTNIFIAPELTLWPLHSSTECQCWATKDTTPFLRVTCTEQPQDLLSRGHLGQPSQKHLGEEDTNQQIFLSMNKKVH